MLTTATASCTATTMIPWSSTLISMKAENFSSQAQAFQMKPEKGTPEDSSSMFRYRPIQETKPTLTPSNKLSQTHSKNSDPKSFWSSAAPTAILTIGLHISD